MPVFIALLRAVNVGGGTQVPMATLRDRVSSAGYGRVRSVLQSGNLIFEGTERPPETVERSLNATVAPTLGARTEFFVRTLPEWRELVAGNPFPREARDDPAHLLVCVLRHTPTAAAWRTLAEAIPGRERVRGIGRAAYLVYPDGVGRSKLTARLIETCLGGPGTSRNWNTVRRLEELAAA